jgi:hypothetical protein
MRDVFRELVARGIRSGVLRENVLELGTMLLMGMMREVIMNDVESQHPSSPQERVAEVLSMFVNGAGVK